VITVIGWDGSPLSTPATQALLTATLVIGARRHLDAVPVPAGARTVAMGDVTAALDALAGHEGDAVVVASGDPGFFGIVRALAERELGCVVLPGVSSVAQAFARAGTPWDDGLVVSAHGRDLRRVVNACRAHHKVAVLTAPGAGPAELGAALRGLPRQLLVAEQLGTASERVTRCSTEEAAAREWVDPNVVLVLGERPPHPGPGWSSPRVWVPEGWALPEEAFEHRDSMITKSEVRAVVLARLAPRLGTLVWDVGAGSGSVAVECARFGAAVVAVERDRQQRELIEANAGHYGVDVHVVAGRAPDVLAELPDPDAVFVGGGGPDVVAAVAARGPVRIVVTLAALERVGPVCEVFSAGGYAVEGVLLQAARLTGLPGAAHRLAATNPVVVLCGQRS